MIQKIKCSIGVFAYNEEKNIAKILDALLNQKCDLIEIEEIIVVSSASSDNTDAIVMDIQKNNSLIQLVQEKERNGKSSAINHFIKIAKSDILVIESADTIPEFDTVEKLILPFNNSKIGMTGGRPIPENSNETLIGFAVNLLWSLHHEMAKTSPKLGEMVAFRKVFHQIPAQSAVDEASIEALIKKEDLNLLYISNAIIHNKGPENLSDFIKQRRRIAAGHLWLQDHQDYHVVSQNKFMLISLLMKACIKQPKNIIKIFIVAILEMLCRILGSYDYKIKKKNPFKWNTIDSSKALNYKNKD